jgi:hypothetical protein
MRAREPLHGRVRAADLVTNPGVPWIGTAEGGAPFFTKGELAAANREAEEMEYAARLRPEVLARLPAGARFPVTLAFAHERPGEQYGPQIRCRVRLSAPAGRVILDITPERFDRLPWDS